MNTPMNKLLAAALASWVLLSACEDEVAPCEGDACADAGVPPVSDAGTIACADFVTPLPFTQQPEGGLRAALTVDLASMADHSRGRCSSSATAGRDAAYLLRLEAAALVRVTATPRAQRDVVLYLRAGTCDAPSDLSCRDDAVRGKLETLDVHLQPGDYVLFVDEFGQGEGEVDLVVTASPMGAAPANDSCALPQALTFTGGEASASGDTTFASNDTPASTGLLTCASASAAARRDVVYTFTVPSGTRKDATVTVTGAGSFVPVVAASVADSCQGPQLACGLGSLTLRELTGGTYSVWVAGHEGTFGPFTLSVTLKDSPPVGGNDTCRNPLPVLEGRASETLSGLTRGAQDNASAPCTFGEGQDVFYSFTTSEVRRFSARVRPEPTSLYRPALYVAPRSGCNANTTVSGTVACAQGGGSGEPVTLEVPELPAGQWLLGVDGLADTAGTFTLELSLDAPRGVPLNDVCLADSPLELEATASGALARVEGTTWKAVDDHAAASSCVGAGPDVAYALTAPASFDGGVVQLKASVWPLNTLGAAPTVYLHTGCDGGVLGCAGAGAGGAAVNAWNVAPRTPVSVWVEGAADGGGGPFGLEVEVATHAPSNDRCEEALTLPIATSVAGSTLGAGADYQGLAQNPPGYYRGGADCAQSLVGAEVVYRFTTEAAGLYTVRLRPSRTFDPGLVVSSDCAPGTCVRSADTGLSGDEERIQLAADAGTSYFLFVDSFSNDPSKGPARGGFVISVEPPP